MKYNQGNVKAQIKTPTATPNAIYKRLVNRVELNMYFSCLIIILVFQFYQSIGVLLRRK